MNESAPQPADHNPARQIAEATTQPPNDDAVPALDTKLASTNRVASHRAGTVSATSHQSDHPIVYSRDSFDIAVLFSSWDPRCLNATQTNLRADRIALVLFDDHGTSGRRDTHDTQLRIFAAERADHVNEVSGSSSDLYPIWNALSDMVTTQASTSSHALRVYVDLSAASRFYALGVIAHALRSHAALVEVTYSEAHYEDAQVHNEHEMFTIGTWRSVAIPGLEGTWDPEERRSWLVTLGFEGTKTFRAVAAADPDRLAVVMPDPAVRPDYVDRTRTRNAELLREYAVPDHYVIKAPAGDAVTAWEQAATFLPAFGTDNVNLVCAGTKPHALAMTLLAMTTETPAVLYLKPDRHKESTTRPTNQHWTYIIRNHAAI